MAPFLVHDQRVGPGLGKRLEVAVRLGDHQVNFQRDRAKRLEPSHDHRPERDIRDEVPVHDVDVNPVRPGGDDLRHLVGQVRQVGREDRRGQLDLVR